MTVDDDNGPYELGCIVNEDMLYILPRLISSRLPHLLSFYPIFKGISHKRGHPYAFPGVNVRLGSEPSGLMRA